MAERCKRLLLIGSGCEGFNMLHIYCRRCPGLTNPRVLSWLAKAMTAANHVKVFQALLLPKQSSQSKTLVARRMVTPKIAAAVLFTPALSMRVKPLQQFAYLGKELNGS